VPRLYVVYDTNTYRRLSSERLQTIMSRELGCGVVGIASFWVAGELLSRLATRESETFKHAWAALRRLRTHCCQFDGARSMRFLVDTEDIVAHNLFGKALPDKSDESTNYTRMIDLISHMNDPSEWEPEQASLESLRDEYDASEREFTARLWRTAILRRVPDATSWDAVSRSPELRAQFLAEVETAGALRMSAAVLVEATAEAVGIALSPQTVETAIEKALRLFPVPIYFLRAIMRQIGQSGRDMSKPENSNCLWDLQLAYSTSAHASINGLPVWFVTSDRELLRAAAEANCSRVVRQFDDYARLVDGPCEALVDEINRAE
jgi:hypothetical protein